MSEVLSWKKYLKLNDRHSINKIASVSDQGIGESKPHMDVIYQSFLSEKGSLYKESYKYWGGK